MHSEKSMQIALGGVFSSLCLFSMFLSSMVPFSSFALPMFAGAMLAVVGIENGNKTALLVYVSVSLLSVFIVPDLDTKIVFILFFGYYSILKPVIEKTHGKPVQIAFKLLVFNTAMVISYYLSVKLFGVEDAAQGSEFFHKYALPLMLAGLNFSFIVYDYLLTRCTAVYLYWFRPRFLRK